MRPAEHGIGRVGVVGAGVMGAEIALVAALAGHPVTLVDVDAGALERARGHVERTAGRMAERGRLDPAEVAPALARIAGAGDAGALAGSDLAIEAVPERADLKRRVLGGIAAAVGPGALVATNTSGISITDLAAAAGDPARFVGLHFFNPASTMRLVEVIRGAGTAPATAERAAAFARGLGKTPVAVAECPGFLVNRILVRALAAAYAAASDAAVAPADADAAVAAGGPAPMGPHALGDLIGLDTLEAIRADLVAAYGARYDDGGALAGLVARGRLGRKAGGGFFDGRAPDGDPAAAGADRVAAAYYGAAADEARRARDEGVAAAPDIDLAMRLGAGWERGPLGDDTAGGTS